VLLSGAFLVPEDVARYLAKADFAPARRSPSL
jgi:hypothetical protein